VYRTTLNLLAGAGGESQRDGAGKQVQGGAVHGSDNAGQRRSRQYRMRAASPSNDESAFSYTSQVLNE
jgi:hypothetical protein